MNQESLTSISNLFLSLAFILFFFFIISIFSIGSLLSKRNEKAYKKSIIKILDQKNKSNILIKIENAYETYQKTRHGFGLYDIVTINQLLLKELRTEAYKKYVDFDIKNVPALADQLDTIINELKEKQRSDEEKLNNLIGKLSQFELHGDKKMLANELKVDIKTYIDNLSSFFEGRLYEKDEQIRRLEIKIKRKKIAAIFSWLGWLIGIISSILTIGQAFLN